MQERLLRGLPWVTNASWAGWPGEPCVWTRGLGLLVVAVVALLLLPTPARAEEGAEFKAYLLSATRLYEDLEYERALEQLSSARRFARTVEDDVSLSLYQGLILADMGKWEDSTAAFKAALFLRPDAQLPMKVSPKVQQHFEHARQLVRRDMAASAAQQAKAQPQPPPPAPAPAPTRPVLTPVAAEPSPVAPVQVAQHSSLRSTALYPAIGGGVLVVAGGVSWALSQKELSRLRNNDSSLVTREDVRNSASRGRTLQTVGVGLVGVGVVGLGAALGMYVWGAPAEGTKLSLSTDGTSAFVQGRWP